MNEKESQFIKTFADYQQKSFELITILCANLDPELSVEKTEHLDKMFHELTDLMEAVKTQGIELQNTIKYPVILAN
jgi:hypothetical protein